MVALNIYKKPTAEGCWPIAEFTESTEFTNLRYLSASPTVFCEICKRYRTSEFFKRRPNGGGFYKRCKDCNECRRNRAVLAEIDINALRHTRQSYDALPHSNKRRRLNTSVTTLEPVQLPTLALTLNHGPLPDPSLPVTSVTPQTFVDIASPPSSPLNTTLDELQPPQEEQLQPPPQELP
ncbi:hypothetical protein B7463_g12277, partial [Scytalidium lignicola]